tara:strand:+ start:485 stop:808 length:324 start_codon:yes stop_codon:yes gene_type:complete
MAQEQQTIPGEKLSEVAKAERDRLFPKNEYSPKSEFYGPQHPNALADGDAKGRGTTVYLGVHDAKTGTNTDIMTREDLIKTNAFNSKNGYSVPDDDVTPGTVGLTPA